MTCEKEEEYLERYMLNTCYFVSWVVPHLLHTSYVTSPTVHRPIGHRTQRGILGHLLLDIRKHNSRSLKFQSKDCPLLKVARDLLWRALGLCMSILVLITVFHVFPFAAGRSDS